jgi:hypothetical protein
MDAAELNDTAVSVSLKQCVVPCDGGDYYHPA